MAQTKQVYLEPMVSTIMATNSTPIISSIISNHRTVDRTKDIIVSTRIVVTDISMVVPIPIVTTINTSKQLRQQVNNMVHISNLVIQI